MKNLCIILIFSTTIFSFAQEIPYSLKELSSINFSVYSEKISCYYDPSVSQIINKKVYPIPNDPFYEVRVLTTKIDRNSSKKYIIDYSPGLSADPTFIIQEQIDDSLKILKWITGTSIFIPGNGSLYVSGHANTMFNVRRKYQIDGNTLTEVKQPFYFVGLESETTQSLNLYSNLDFNEVVAVLPEQSPVTVLVNLKKYYLLKTSFGLVGWTKIEDVTYGYSPIKGLYFAGD